MQNTSVWSIGRRLRVLLFTLAALVLIGAGLYASGVSLPLLALGASAVLFGVNTVTYTTPVAGVTAPTATQARTHQLLKATITGDGAAVTFTVTHNWNLSAALLAKGFPLVYYEYLLAAGYTGAPLITSRTANTVVFSNTAFTGAGLVVTLSRPWSALR
jgi:hypothetical protein